MTKDIKGYYLWKGKWRASISINGKQKVLGLFEKEEDAKEAYLKAVEEKNKKISYPTDFDQFLDIPTYNGEYKVTRDGRVYSFKNNKILEMKTRVSKTGYKVITLNKNNKPKTLKLHRILYQVFIGDIPNKMEIDHIDRDKLNNDLTNLRITSRSENEKNKNRKGYFFDKVRGLWKVEIKSDRKRYYIGHYKNEDDARASYISAKEKYHNIKLPE